MAIVTRDDIARLFPGIDDHTVVEILDSNATFAELEAAALLLQDTDDDLISIRRRHGDTINRLLDILGNTEIRPRDDDSD
jgi:hypothetical protein